MPRNTLKRPRPSATLACDVLRAPTTSLGEIKAITSQGHSHTLLILNSEHPRYAMGITTLDTPSEFAAVYPFVLPTQQAPASLLKLQERMLEKLRENTVDEEKRFAVWIRFADTPAASNLKAATLVSHHFAGATSGLLCAQRGDAGKSVAQLQRECATWLQSKPPSPRRHRPPSTPN